MLKKPVVGGSRTGARLRLRFIVTTALCLLFVMHGVAFAQRHNAESKWGTTFYYWQWYNTSGLADYAIPPSLSPWGPQDQSWWNAVVERAQFAGLRWMAANSWGANSAADPANLGGLVQAITANGNHMKVALFDDTTSEVLRKNLAKYGCWSLPGQPCPGVSADTLRFDLSDSNGVGEGGWSYFYDLQWKRFFQTVPDSQLFKIDGRPVIFLWHSAGEQWYKNPAAFDGMLAALKAATQAEFGFVPYVIIESTSSWAQPQYSMAHVDAIYTWFGIIDNNYHPYKSSNTVSGGAMSVAMAIPGYFTPDQKAYRKGGTVYKYNLDAIVGLNPEIIMLESIGNAEENAHLIETTEWGSTYLDITREYTLGMPAQPPDQPTVGILRANEQLTPGQSKCSTSSRFCLDYQGDGNLVLYEQGLAIWSTATYWASAGQAVMQGDGNFVIYDANGGYVWDSGTAGNNGAYLVVHSDGDLLIYSASGGLLWQRQ